MAAHILITGGLGLIGSQVRSLLEHSGAPAAVLEQVVDNWDLLAHGAPERILAITQPEVVLHLAWVASGTSGYRSHAANPRWALATRELAQACLARGTWFIGTGTIAELDPAAKDEYTAAKVDVFRSLAAETAAERITWLRPHFVFDPESGRPEVMAEIRRAIAEARKPNLRDPRAAHDFVHVRDVAAGICLVLAQGLRGLVPLGSGQNHTVAQLARAAGASGVPSAEPDVACDHLTADTSRLADLGWSPRWTREYFDD